jgi:hypothetical protein
MPQMLRSYPYQEGRAQTTQKSGLHLLQRQPQAQAKARITYC